MYQSLRGRGRVVLLLLGLNVVSVLVLIPSSLMQLELLDRVAIGDYTEAELTANDTREQLLGFASTGIYLITAVAFLMWFHRAYGNTRAFGHHPAHGLGWAAGAWFVPILSLFRPYQIAREIWTASDPNASETDSIVPKGSPILATWWTAWIIDNIAGQITFRFFMNAQTVEALQDATLVQIANCVSTLVTAPLAMVVVHRITQNQETRAARAEGLAEQELSALEQTFE